MVHFPKKNNGSIFFLRKKGQTGGGSEGGLSKGHNFSGFFSEPFPNIYECQKYFVIFSFGHEMGHGIGLAHNRSEKYWQVGVF